MLAAIENYSQEKLKVLSKNLSDSRFLLFQNKITEQFLFSTLSDALTTGRDADSIKIAYIVRPIAYWRPASE
jgi:hypothetical protein